MKKEIEYNFDEILKEFRCGKKLTSKGGGSVVRFSKSY